MSINRYCYYYYYYYYSLREGALSKVIKYDTNYCIRIRSLDAIFHIQFLFFSVFSLIVYGKDEYKWFVYRLNSLLLFRIFLSCQI